MGCPIDPKSNDKLAEARQWRQIRRCSWRREANRQHEVAMAMAKHYQATEKARRAKEHGEALGRVEQLAVPFDERREAVESGEASDSTEKASHRSLFQPGSRVWLFMERVKPGLTKKLAHRWYRPFRIKRKVEENLPDKAGYRFYPVVHVSRLKAVSEDDRRPTVELVDGLSEDERFDFDEELLPEDSWEPEAGDDKYIVEVILDDRWPISTGTERRQREFYVKWWGYDEPTWEPISNLSCGGILFDYLLQRKREDRLQMVQVADES
ncbi:unnamed protein product [Phytophthora lilii]|uniref:Unnamed protein product n=1 Tax=Phytophthora lilii TaxID=2077276 RepID=A0A9W6XI41_9STRA|nr:unnamed protein product [Phytophthora lilii]